MQRIARDLKGKPIEKLNFITDGGIGGKPVYRKEDLPEGLEKSFPGIGDLRRGEHPLMHAHGGWWMIGEFNLLAAEKVTELLRGPDQFHIHGIRLRFPEGPGIVRGRPPVTGETNEATQVFGGPVGPGHLASIVRALNEDTLIFLEAGRSPLGGAAMLFAAAQEAGIDPARLSGTIEHDPLNLLWNCADQPGVLVEIMDDTEALLRFRQRHLAYFTALQLDAGFFHEMGASKTQEIAFTLAKTVELIVLLTERGFDPGMAFRAIAYQFQVGTDFFGEIAKLRAFRVLHARIADKYGVQKPAARIMASGSRWRSTSLDAHTNLLRATTAAMAAILVGIRYISLPPFNAQTEVFDADASRIARNIQLILSDESHLDRVIDPAGGSYFAEAMTERLMEESWKIFLEIEEGGGYLKMLRAGKIAEWVKAVQAKKQDRIDKGKEVLIGVNRFPNTAARPETYLKGWIMPHQTEMREGVTHALNHSDLATRGMKIAEQFQHGSLAHAEGWWDYLVHLQNTRAQGYMWQESRANAAAEFEQLRQAVEISVGKSGKRPAAFLLTFGNLTMRKARANFALNLLGCGGIEAVENPAPEELTKTMEALVEHQPAVVVLCSDNAAYFEQGPEMLALIRNKLPEAKLILAGRPPDWEGLKAHGLDDCIFMGMDMKSWLYALVEPLITGKEAQNEA